MRKKSITTAAALMLAATLSVPMQAQAYYTFQGEDCSEYEFYDDDGQTVCVSDLDADMVILIYGRESCGNCQATTKAAYELAKSGLPVQPVFLKIDTTDYGWDEYVNKYGDAFIMSDYSPRTNNSASWSAPMNEERSGTLPTVVILGPDRKVIDSWTGYQVNRLISDIRSSVSIEDVFTDVRQNNWFASAVKFAYANNIMKGKANGVFAPNDLITRAELVTCLHNYENPSSRSFSSGIFSDVRSSSVWYAFPVMWAYRNGIVKGYSNSYGGKFGVNDPITREQLAQILYKYAEYKGYSLEYQENVRQNFSDQNKISNWAIPAMEWAISKGIISGKGKEDPKLDPLGNATRAESAQMIKSFLEKVVE